MANSTITEKIAQTELERQRIIANIAAAYDEAEAKGATIPATENSANLPTAIRSIPKTAQFILISKQIAKNGTYNASEDNADGYSEVIVDVPDESKNMLNSLIDRSITTITGDATSIGQSAFSEIKMLEEANFSKAIIIGQSAFFRCSALTEINFPEVTFIGSNAFYGCTALTEVNFPKVTSIGSNAFSGCTSIKYFDMSEVAKVPTISSNTFSNTTCIFLFRDQAQFDEYANATNWSALASRFQIKEATT